MNNGRWGEESGSAEASPGLHEEIGPSHLRGNLCIFCFPGCRVAKEVKETLPGNFPSWEWNSQPSGLLQWPLSQSKVLWGLCIRIATPLHCFSLSSSRAHRLGPPESPSRRPPDLPQLPQGPLTLFPVGSALSRTEAGSISRRTNPRSPNPLAPPSTPPTTAISQSRPAPAPRAVQ